MNSKFHKKYFDNCDVSHETAVLAFNNLLRFGERSTCTVTNIAECISSLHLNISFPALPDGIIWEPYVVFKVIKNLSYYVEGQEIKKFNWIGVYIESLFNGFSTHLLNDMGLAMNLDPHTTHNLRIPLPYITKKDFPLILYKLKFSAVRIRVELESVDNLVQNLHEHSSIDHYSGNISGSITANYIRISDKGRKFIDQIDEIIYNILVPSIQSEIISSVCSVLQINYLNAHNMFMYIESNGKLISNTNIKFDLEYNENALMSQVGSIYTRMITWILHNTDCSLPINYFPLANILERNKLYPASQDKLNLTTCIGSNSYSGNINAIVFHKMDFVINNGMGFIVPDYSFIDNNIHNTFSQIYTSDDIDIDSVNDADKYEIDIYI